MAGLPALFPELIADPVSTDQLMVGSNGPVAVRAIRDRGAAARPRNMPIIEVENLHKRYGEKGAPGEKFRERLREEVGSR